MTHIQGWLTAVSSASKTESCKTESCFSRVEDSGPYQSWAFFPQRLKRSDTERGRSRAVGGRKVLEKLLSFFWWVS